MVIPDYICSLPEMKSLMVSSVDGLTLTYRFALRGQESQALHFRREIHKCRAAAEVIFSVFLPNGWLLLLRQISFVGTGKAGLVHVQIAFAGRAVQCVCRRDRACAGFAV